MESTRNRYYDITKRLLYYAGQWPYQTRRTRFFGITVISAFTLSLIIPQVCKFICCDGNVQCIMSTIPSYLLTAMIMVKLYTCQLNSDKIKRLTDRLFGNWERLETPEEHGIMIAYAENGRLLSFIYSSYCFLAAFLFVAISLTPQLLDVVLPLNESRPPLLPYEGYYFVDEREYYVYILVHSLVAVEIGLIGLLAHDCMFLTYSEHACSIFAVAGFHFERFACNPTVTTGIINNHYRTNMYNKKIAFCLHIHWRALEFAELLESTFSLTLTIQVAMITIAMSITLVQITLQSADILEATRYVIYVAAQLIHLFCFSMQGQRLIDHSLRTRDKIYCASWYEIPAKSQKLLVNVMRRSLQPSIVSASRMFTFSLQSFTTIVQTAMSYFCVLQSFQ